MFQFISQFLFCQWTTKCYMFLFRQWTTKQYCMYLFLGCVPVVRMCTILCFDQAGNSRITDQRSYFVAYCFICCHVSYPLDIPKNSLFINHNLGGTYFECLIEFISYMRWTSYDSKALSMHILASQVWNVRPLESVQPL